MKHQHLLHSHITSSVTEVMKQFTDNGTASGIMEHHGLARVARPSHFTRQLL